MTVRMNSFRLGPPRPCGPSAVIKRITKAALRRLNVKGVYFQAVLTVSILVFSFLTVLPAAALMGYGELRALYAAKLKSLNYFVHEINLIYGQVQSSISGCCTPQNLERLQEVLLNQYAVVHIGLGFAGQGAEHQFSEAMLPDLMKLRSAVLLIAIDDFGTGYSNLGKLGTISPNYLKIDKSFISDVNNANVAASLVPEIVGVTKAIGCELIAEGIETQVQL